MNRGTEEIDGQDVLAFGGAASGLQVIVDRFEADDFSAGICLEGDKDIHIERSHGLEIKGRAYRSADGIAIDDAIGLHAVDCCDDFFYAHAREVSPKSRYPQRRSLASECEMQKSDYGMIQGGGKKEELGTEKSAK